MLPCHKHGSIALTWRAWAVSQVYTAPVRNELQPLAAFAVRIRYHVWGPVKAPTEDARHHDCSGRHARYIQCWPLRPRRRGPNLTGPPDWCSRRSRLPAGFLPTTWKSGRHNAQDLVQQWSGDRPGEAVPYSIR